MGHVYAEIVLMNSFEVTAAKKGLIAKEDVKRLTVNALVDSGVATLTISEEIAEQLGLVVQEQMKVTLADGSCRLCDIVGPIDIRFANRSACCRAFLLPEADEILLGVIPLEEMDVIIDPTSQKLVVHPDRPQGAQLRLK